MVEGLKLHDRTGQLLGQSVVDLVGNHLAFVIAGLQEVIESPVFPLQGFVGSFSLRDVSNHGHDSIWLSRGVLDHGRGCLDRNRASILAKRRVLRVSSHPHFHHVGHVSCQTLPVVLDHVIEHASTDHIVGIARPSNAHVAGKRRAPARPSPT